MTSTMDQIKEKYQMIFHRTEWSFMIPELGSAKIHSKTPPYFILLWT